MSQSSNSDSDLDYDKIPDEADIEQTRPKNLIPHRRKFAVILPPFTLNRDEYKFFAVLQQGLAVARITGEKSEDGDILYHAQFEDGTKSWLSFEILLGLDNGNDALEVYESGGTATDNSQSHNKIPTDVDDSSQDETDDGDLDENPPIRASARVKARPSARNSVRGTKRTWHDSPEEMGTWSSRSTRPTRTSRSKNTTNSTFQSLSYNEPEGSMSTRHGKKRKRQMEEEFESSEEDTGKRRSGRTKNTKWQLKGDHLADDFDEMEATPKKPRAVHQKEFFDELDENDEFVKLHRRICESCGERRNKEKGPLINCQGCSTSYHYQCIGTRSGRKHLVTKINDTQFVLQCRYCINEARKKDPLAPHLNICNVCRKPGAGSEPFSSLPAKNSAVDVMPEHEIPPEKLNNPANVMFRCGGCRRAYHFEELPERELPFGHRPIVGTVAQIRHNEYLQDWRCTTCAEYKDKKISKLIAWRTVNKEAQDATEMVDLHILETQEDDREYLFIFEEESYFSAQWQPGPWVWGLASTNMLAAFTKNNQYPKWTTEDAVPEDYLRIEIVFDVKYSSIVPPSSRTEAVDKSRIKEITEALVKFKGLTYEESVWIEPPPKDAPERYADWLRAYNHQVKGNYLHLPKGLPAKLEKLREENEFKDLELQRQPKYLSGGELMSYQIEGMNWMYYKWFTQQNALLADEMGLGKTIQVVAFLSVLLNEHKTWPFLIVAPHSTVPNWVREIQKWCPSMRVVAYFGAAAARDLTRKYELFHPNTKDLKCHVVVTSYQTPIDDSYVLKNIPWAEMIVDEGQRLKNEDSLLYQTLSKFRIAHRTLLTGTPLQNNTRELFNLLQFLDPNSMVAEELEEQYGEVTQDNLKSIHDLIRKFMLRRTKREALKDLPPISEVIVPVSLTSLQKKLYKSVLSNDAELIRAILSRDSVKKDKRTKLNNMMMQLRKVACHPFVYAPDIEEDNLGNMELMHRGLVDAGAKLKLLEIMLPKLQQQGHRVLMFSQFLSMLDVVEDFLDGLGMQKLRLDGSNSTAEKQRLIDDYNAPNSQYFAFLLSTKAGGVGINLATADTVIILDHDFNPHTDMQAISRAHRIGQKNKVLVFHLMTQDCVEERILQIAKKKMSLDHVIIQAMGKEGEEDVDPVDVESILKHGAEAIMTDTAKDIVYTPEKVDLLLDRSQMVDAPAPIDDTMSSEEASFAFARVWADESADLQGPLAIDEPFDGRPANLETWDRIIADREAEAAAEKEKNITEMGRGHRRSGRVTNYVEEHDVTPVKVMKGHSFKNDDDTDFQASGGESDEDDEGTAEPDGNVMNELSMQERLKKARPDLPSILSEKVRLNLPSTPSQEPYRPPLYPPGFRVNELQFNHTQTQVNYVDSNGSYTDPRNRNQSANPYGPRSLAPFVPLPNGHNSKNIEKAIASTPDMNFWSPAGYPTPEAYRRAMLAPKQSSKSLRTQPPFDPSIKGVIYANVDCNLCYTSHPPGQCQYRYAPVEICPLCRIAHFGAGPVCPHLGSETQITLMLETLRYSTEPKELVNAAKEYLRGRKGALQKRKKEAGKKAERAAAMMVRGVEEDSVVAP